MTLFKIGFALPYFSCCSVLQLSFYPHLLGHWHTKKAGSCRDLAACDTPATLGWLTLLAEQVPSDSSHSWLQLGLLAEALHLGRGEVSLPQDSLLSFLTPSDAGPQLQVVLGIKAAQL